MGSNLPATRQRASAACASCRKRRTRCLRGPSDVACLPCTRRGSICETKVEDHRKRPTSIAYIESLQRRISSLESRLQASTTSSSEALASASTSSSDQQPTINQMGANSPQTLQTATNTTIESGPVSDEVNVHHGMDATVHGRRRSSRSSARPPSQPQLEMDFTIDISHGATYSKSPISSVFEHGITELHGRPSQVLESCLFSSTCTASPRSQTQDDNGWTRHLVDQLSSSCEQYLFDCFWTRHNSIYHVVDRERFFKAKETGDKQCYSLFLHLAILAVGLRYAEHGRSELWGLSSQIHKVDPRQSVLHQECRLMVESELAGEPTVALSQGLLLLAELEMQRGTESLSCLLTGIAYRLCLETRPGLNVDEPRFRDALWHSKRSVLEACLIHDTFRSLMLHRPTLVRLCDVKPLRDSYGDPRQMPEPEDQEQYIHTTLVDLAEIVHDFVEKIKPGSNCTTDASTYFETTTAHQKLAQRLSLLPAPLKLDPKTSPKGSYSLSFLHLYYHNAVICLHRRFAFRSDKTDVPEEEHMEMYRSVYQSSRTTCLDHAMAVARILKQWQELFKDTKIPVPCLKYASNAMESVIDGLGQQKASVDQSEALQSLRFLRNVIADMDVDFQRASKALSSPRDPGDLLRQSHRALEENRRPSTTISLPGHGNEATLSLHSPANVSEPPMVDPGHHRNDLHFSLEQLHQKPSWQASDGTMTARQNPAAGATYDSLRATIFNLRDPAYDPIFRPKERQLLGLSLYAPASSKDGAAGRLITQSPIGDRTHRSSDSANSPPF